MASTYLGGQLAHLQGLSQILGLLEKASSNKRWNDEVLDKYASLYVPTSLLS